MHQGVVAGKCIREKSQHLRTHENVAAACFKDMLRTSFDTSRGQNHPQIGVT